MQLSLFPSFEVKAVLAKKSLLLQGYQRTRGQQQKACMHPLLPSTYEKGKYSTVKLLICFKDN